MYQPVAHQGRLDELLSALNKSTNVTDLLHILMKQSLNVLITAGLECDGIMLSTMLHCASHDAPILVWACTHTKRDQTMPAVEVANTLQLMQLTHPWKVSLI